MSVAVTIARGPEALEESGLAWDAISAEPHRCGPFALRSYHRAWWSGLAPAGAELAVLTVYKAGAPVAILPVNYEPETGRVRFNGAKAETDYLDLVATAHVRAVAWPAALDALDEVLDWRRLSLDNLDRRTGSAEVVCRWAAARGYLATSTLQTTCPTIRLPADFATFLAELPRHERKEIQRKERVAERRGVHIETCPPNGDLIAAMEVFLELFRRSGAAKAAWLTPARRRFLRALAISGAESALHIMVLRAEGEPLAALCFFQAGERSLAYNSALRDDLGPGLSLGSVLFAAAIRHAIAAGSREFNLLRGREPYKYRLGAEDQHLLNVQVRRERPIGGEIP